MNTSKFLKTHQEWVLGIIALGLGAVVAGVFFWGIADVALDLGSAIAPRHGGNAEAGFDLEGAKRLDLKGLAQ
jgi:hypothetical protein